MFTDVSTCIVRNEPALNYGVAVADIDGDGADEFFVCGYEGPNRVWKWSHGQLVDATHPALADAGAHTVCACAADFDGCGREELYLMHADTFAGPKAKPDRLYQYSPASGWRDHFRTAPPAIRNTLSGRSVAAIDRRGTGRYGFAVANYASPLRLYEQRSDGTPIDVAPSLSWKGMVCGRALWVGPLSSSHSDLFCLNEQGPNLLYRNNGRGGFDDVAAELQIADARENARGIAVFDADNDGRLDFAYGNWDGPNRLMVRQPAGTFKDRATPALALPGRIRTVIAADFDNDGWEELFFHFLGEPNRLFRHSPGDPYSIDWRMNDPGPAQEPAGTGTGAAYADIDGDGVLELLLAHGEGEAQPLSLFKVPDAAANHWIRIRPLTRFGAPARGATVRLTAGGRTQIRIIDGGSGYLCQMEPVAHFGLGKVEEIESVRVQWPDGTGITLTGLPLRTTQVVPYPRG
jgi:hypothetical protein